MSGTPTPTSTVPLDPKVVDLARHIIEDLADGRHTTRDIIGAALLVAAQVYAATGRAAHQAENLHRMLDALLTSCCDLAQDQRAKGSH